MLPTTWTTPRLLCRDAAPEDLALLMQALAESQDMAALDPAFGAAPEAEVRGHIDRHVKAAQEADRSTGALPAVQMQLIFRHEGHGEGANAGAAAAASLPEAFVGFWRLVGIPGSTQAVGVEILLLRPAHRQAGLGRELVAHALAHLRGHCTELWARVYLANVRALAFWTAAGLNRVVKHGGAHVHGLGTEDRPNIILAGEVAAAVHQTELAPLPAITPGRWRHYKGLDYEVLGVVRHSETLEPLVLYRPRYQDSGSWVRPYAMFLESVEVEGRQRPRFARLDDG